MKSRELSVDGTANVLRGIEFGVEAAEVEDGPLARDREEWVGESVGEGVMMSVGSA